MGKQHANGWRVSRHRLVADVTVGVIANPMSGRDIQRLVASASVFPNAEKASMLVGLTAAAGRLCVAGPWAFPMTVANAAIQPRATGAMSFFITG